MQEEIEQKSFNIMISTTKLSARTVLRAVKAAFRLYQSNASQGKQSVRTLLRQNRGVSSVEISKTGIRGLERYSANPTDNDFTPFLNIMNEWYAKDTSNKIRAVFKSRMKDGKRCSGSIPYGYKRIPGDKQTLHVDEEAASVVRRIFDMAASGASLAQIGQTLSDEKVLIPSAYEERHHPEAARNHSYHDPYRWNTTTLTYILDRQEYLGHTVLCKSGYLAKLDKQAEEQLVLTVRQMQKAEDVTEDLKAADQLEWVLRMNSIRNRAEEIIKSELIFV